MLKLTVLEKAQCSDECETFYLTKSALMLDPHWQKFQHIMALRSNKKVTITNEYCYIYCGILFMDNMLILYITILICNSHFFVTS